MAQIVSLSWLFTSTLASAPNLPATLHPLLPSLSEGYFPRMEAGRWKKTDQACIVTLKAQRKHRLLKHSWNLPGWALCVNTTTFFIPGLFLRLRMCYLPHQRSFNQLQHKHASKTGTSKFCKTSAEFLPAPCVSPTFTQLILIWLHSWKVLPECAALQLLCVCHCEATHDGETTVWAINGATKIYNKFGGAVN